jgi:hypothetical protein
MNHNELIHFLKSLGIPEDKLEAMSAQLEKRAQQIAEKKNQSYDDALIYLVNLLKQGWAAKQKNIQ